MRNPIFYFLMLVLGILLNPVSNAGHKRGRFSQTLSKKSLKFVSSRRSGTVTLNLDLVRRSEILSRSGDISPKNNWKGCGSTIVLSRGFRNTSNKLIFAIKEKITASTQVDHQIDWIDYLQRYLQIFVIFLNRMADLLGWKF